MCFNNVENEMCLNHTVEHGSRNSRMSEEGNSIDTKNKSEAIDEKSSKNKRNTLIAKEPHHCAYCSRKRRLTRVLSDEYKVGSASVRKNLEKKNSLDTETTSQKIELQSTEIPSEKQQESSAYLDPGSSKQSNRNICPENPAQVAESKSKVRDEVEISSRASRGTSTRSILKPSASPNLVDILVKLDDLFVGDEDGDTILHMAIVHKNIPLTLATILAMVRRKEENSEGINIPNDLRQTALHLAVLTCQPVVVRSLLQHGANVNAADRNGQTALHLACKNADIEDIRALKESQRKETEQSIDVNIKNFEGLAPIHLASVTGSCEVIELLLKMGADVNLKDSKSGRTALHHAVEAHNPIVTRFLLSKEANVNAQTFAGNTPLHTAGGCNMENILHILIEFGADRRLTNFEGDLPIPETYMVEHICSIKDWSAKKLLF